MKLHALAVPHTVTTKEYLSCAFTQKVLKFCKMITPHYEVIHYGHEDSKVDCEHVTVTTNKTLEKAYGSYDWKKEFFKHNTADHAHQTFYKNAKNKLNERVEQGDAILCFWGYGHQPATEGLEDKAFIIEPGIGYGAGGTFAPHKVFESYAIMHTIYGEKRTVHPPWYDAVIPNYFELEDFEYQEKKKDYFLYLGRITEIKGINIAIQLTKEIGSKLVIAGQGNLKELGYHTIPPHVECVGFADVKKRKRLMKNAKALLLPTHYIEPFGGVTIEAMLCGTPIITTDWGCFAENNIHGKTGYRCRTMEHFTWAAKNIDKIKPQNCRKWAERNFSLERVGKMYDEYFRSIRNLSNAGFYEKNPERKDLNWIKKFY
jgi:glycosyltransferase involved in cell wall biosynthesis